MKTNSFLILLCGISMTMMMMQSSTTMAEKAYPLAAYAPESEEAHNIYIVFTEKPHRHARSHYIHILSHVLGSKEAAKEALIYVYTKASTGFSAWLTPRQADEVSRQHKVLLVIQSKDLKLEPWNSVLSLQ